MAEGLTILAVQLPAADAPEISDWITEQFERYPIEFSKPNENLVWLETYFDDALEADLAGHALGAASELSWSTRACPDRDWAEFWKIHFKPLAIGEGLIICPPWDQDPAEAADRLKLIINPGMSFGTGKHFTTRFCLETLERILQPGQTIYDAGTGSGIIAIAAAQLGAGRILGVDNDPVALEYARANTELNGVPQIELEVVDLMEEQISETWDIVFANIYGHVLVQLAEKLIDASHGVLVMSGIRAIEGDMVAQAFSELGCTEVARDSDHEWCGLVMETP